MHKLSVFWHYLHCSPEVIVQCNIQNIHTLHERLQERVDEDAGDIHGLPDRGGGGHGHGLPGRAGHLLPAGGGHRGHTRQAGGPLEPGTVRYSTVQYTVHTGTRHTPSCGSTSPHSTTGWPPAFWGWAGPTSPPSRARNESSRRIVPALYRSQVLAHYEQALATHLATGRVRFLGQCRHVGGGTVVSLLEESLVYKAGQLQSRSSL